MGNILRDLNNLSGFFLLAIGLGIGSIARSLFEISSTLNCLHDDFEQAHDSHSRFDES